MATLGDEVVKQHGLTAEAANILQDQLRQQHEILGQGKAQLEAYLGQEER